VILVTRDRSDWKIIARSEKSSTEESIVEEYMLQGVHRSRYLTKCRRKCPESQVS
jgi:hypothetical protein